LKKFTSKMREPFLSSLRYDELVKSRPDLTWLLLRDPELRSRTGHLLRQLFPQIRSLLEGEEAIFTNEIMQEIKSLLDQFEAQASPELEEVLDQLIWKLNNSEFLDLESIGISVRAD